MKKRIAIIGGILVAVCLIGGLSWYFLRGKSAGSKEDAVYVTTVSSLTNTASGVQNRYAGVVEPQKTVKVKLDSSRKVKDVKVQVGQQVNPGSPLFEYDITSSEDDLTQAELELESLKNDYSGYEEQLKTLEKEKKEASKDDQLSYTIQIQTMKMNMKKNEYSQKTKAAEIEKLKKAAQNSMVTSEVAGVIKSIDTSKIDSEGSGDSPDMSGSGDSSDSAFITILGTGTYRVKGKVNEQNVPSIVQGDPVIVRSRVDSSQTWTGTMESVDMENPDNSANTNNMYYSMGGAQDTQTTSTSYPFYVTLESSEGLMLGQHVYIEMDYGQDEVQEGLWLEEFYIVDPEEDPYVWVSDSKDKLEKRKVTLGEYDENLGKYLIKKGLSEDDCIAFPDASLEEGMPTAINDGAQMPTGANEDPMEGDMSLPSDDGVDMEGSQEPSGDAGIDSGGGPEDALEVEGTPQSGVSAEDAIQEEGVAP